MDILKTERTYATRENAIKALASKCDLERERWMIAVTEDGRFAPVVIHDNGGNLHLAHEGITVVG